jgi:acid phosphatase type 7
MSIDWKSGVIALLAASALTACSSPPVRPEQASGASAPADAPVARIADAPRGTALVFVAYGDMRFTTPTETVASQPQARQALVAKVAQEQPRALFLNGDVPLRGGNVDDYRVFAEETLAWRQAGLRVFPALGNHEFSQCEESRCLENWWSAFPELRGRRWYSVALGTRILAINLDSDASLLPGSAQREWLESQVSELSPQVRFVMISLHHPPVEDLQTGSLADHNPRPNEISLAQYLARVATTSRARFIVSAGHTHNYERIERDGVVYLVSGGGGARPYAVERGPDDLYQDPSFPNFHYLRFELQGDRLSAQMIRLADPDAAAGAATWEVKDRFEVVAKAK